MLIIINPIRFNNWSNSHKLFHLMNHIVGIANDVVMVDHQERLVHFESCQPHRKIPRKKIRNNIYSRVNTFLLITDGIYHGGNTLEEIPERRYPGGDILEERPWRRYPGRETLEEIHWKRYPGRYTLEEIPWRRYHGGDTLNDIPWRRYAGGESWRRYPKVAECLPVDKRTYITIKSITLNVNNTILKTVNVDLFQRLKLCYQWPSIGRNLCVLL